MIIVLNDMEDDMREHSEGVGSHTHVYALLYEPICEGVEGSWEWPGAK